MNQSILDLQQNLIVWNHNCCKNILPKENDIIIMEGRVPHVPASARKSTKDRIVIAGNVGFEMIKKTNSLI